VVDFFCPLGYPRGVFRGVGGAQRQRAVAAAGGLGSLLEGAQLPHPRRAGDFFVVISVFFVSLQFVFVGHGHPVTWTNEQIPMDGWMDGVDGWMGGIGNIYYKY